MQARTRRTTGDRRREIVEAALHIMGQRGVTSLTTATLAAEVGLTSGALFRHFRSKEEILSEAVAYAVERIEATLPDPNLPPLPRLLTMAKKRVELVAANTDIAWLLRSEQAYLTLPEDGVRLLRELVAQSRRIILKALTDGSKDGSIRRDIEPRDLLVTVMGTIHALMGRPGIEQSSPDASERGLHALAVLLSPPTPIANEQTF